VKVSTPDPNLATPASPVSPSSGERGRSSQRIGSASYERIQDANRGSYSPGAGIAGPAPAAGSGGSSSSRTRSNSYNSNSNSSVDGTTPNANASSSSNSAGGQYSNTYGHKPSERRDSFRGKAGDGSKAMGSQSGSYAAAAAALQGKKGQKGSSSSNSSAAFDSDSDGRGSFDFASPGYPASPQLDNDQGESGDNNDAKLYGRKGDATQWADTASRGKAAYGKRQSSSKGQSEDVGEQSTRLSVDLDNLPSNTSNIYSAQVGPTPLNTPTFSLARSRASRHAKSASASSSSSTADASADKAEKGQESPTMPKRSSATGALVAPSDADKDAGVRVPLAHDYVEEDEGGIVGRAVEIVNTARDLIGALLGTGGDRGRSWRESY
jgi:hypothetical protein